MDGKKTANIEIKKLNRTNIYRLFRDNNDLSRQDVVMRLQLSLPTVTQNLQEMQEEGLIAESGSAGNTGGRRATTYSIVKDARLALGMDITEHHVTAVAVNLCGEIIGRLRVKRKFVRSDEYFEKLGQMTEELTDNAGLERSRILGVGIAVPGLISQDHQRVVYGKILNFTGATCAEFSQHIAYHTSLHNDANAAGFAETWANRDMGNCFYLMLSNNVGGAVLLNNQVYHGDNLRSGEVGHMTIVPDGKPCYCGQRGCVDPYCASTVLSSRTDGNLSLFFQRLKTGEYPELTAVWQEYLCHLVFTVNNIRMLFDCPVILGGYVGEYLDDFIDELKAMAKAKNTFENNAEYLRTCRYKIEAIAAGAALNFISDFVDSI